MSRTPLLALLAVCATASLLLVGAELHAEKAAPAARTKQAPAQRCDTNIEVRDLDAHVQERGEEGYRLLDVEMVPAGMKMKAVACFILDAALQK